MNIPIFYLENCRQTASKRIINTILPLSEKEVDEEALQIILFATENGLGCRKTAEIIAETIEVSANMPKTFFSIIKELSLSDYFMPSDKIAADIEIYLKRATSLFPSESALFEESISLMEIGSLQAEEQT